MVIYFYRSFITGGADTLVRLFQSDMEDNDATPPGFEFHQDSVTCIASNHVNDILYSRSMEFSLNDNGLFIEGLFCHGIRR
jgi:hypothetical protein